jgi:hypothetical protein
MLRHTSTSAPSRTPLFRLGQRVEDVRRGTVRIVGLSDGQIRGPSATGPGGRSLVLYSNLAVRSRGRAVFVRICATATGQEARARVTSSASSAQSQSRRKRIARRSVEPQESAQKRGRPDPLATGRLRSQNDAAFCRRPLPCPLPP